MKYSGLSSGEIQRLAASFVAGSLATYGVATALGYLPWWFGPELRSWNREFWDSPACELLDKLDNDPDFKLYRPLESNRNFLTTGPHSDSTPNTRVRRVLYYSRKHKLLKGVVHFGADTEGPPRCVHGGCTAAFLDAVAGVAAYRTNRMPCLTVNLSINYKEKIPLGSQLGVECKHESSEGLRKSSFSFRLYNLRDENKVYADGTAIFINAIVPSRKKGLPPFLSLK